MATETERPPLDVDRLRSGLDFYAGVEVVEQTGSTNADLLARAGDADADRTALIAEYQEHGRGRHSRTWVSPARAQIALSVLFRMPADVDTANLGWLPLLTGVAVVDALRSVAKVNADLKWPNDVLIDGKKVAGILAEMAWPERASSGRSNGSEAGSSGRSAGSAPAVVVGVGLNVSLTEDELPAPEATSLTLAGAAVTDRTEIAHALLEHLGARWQNWRDGGWSGDAVARDYRAHCVTLGGNVRADLPGGDAVVGIARDIDANGRLLIVTESGTVAVSAGDVTHLRDGK